jgi:hypothetical protein
MKWFKHDSDARNSLKLRKVRRKYGADGYAIYWFCLEAIAYDVDKDNLTFDLKEDAETIAFELAIQEKRVEEIMIYLVNVGLFENTNNTITCLKLAERLDKSMTNSPKMRAWLDSNNVKKLSSDVMTCADDVKTCAELDKTRLDKIRKDNIKDNTQQAAIPFDEIKHLFNTAIISTGANWSKIDVMNPARKKTIGRLIKFAKARIKNIDLKENEQPETPAEYIGRLFLMMGQDEFYSGKKPSAAYPTGYRWSFDDITREKHIVKFIEGTA